MKLADLPTRVVRPLGEWEEPAAPKFERPRRLPKTIKGTVRDRVLSLVCKGVTSASDLAKQIGVTHQSVHYHLRCLEAEGRVTCIEPPRSKLGRGSVPMVWVAL